MVASASSLVVSASGSGICALAGTVITVPVFVIICEIIADTVIILIHPAVGTTGVSPAVIGTAAAFAAICAVMGSAGLRCKHRYRHAECGDARKPCKNQFFHVLTS